MTSVSLPPAPAAPGDRPAFAPRAAAMRPPRQVRMAAGLHALLDRFERVYAVALLLVFSDAVIPLVRSAAGAVPDLENGDPHRQAMLFGFFGVCALLCALRPREIATAALRNPLTLLLIAFAILSRDWSHAPDITLRRGIALAGTTMCGVWLAGRFRGRELMEMLGWAMGIAAVLSLLFALLIPELGIHQDGDFAGAWRGIYLQKNGLGKMMVLGTLTFILLTLREEGRARRKWQALAFLCAALVLLSTSTTSMLILGALVLLVPLYRALAARSRWLVPVALGIALPVAAIVLAVVADVEAALDLFGKDATLTGRTELWEYAAATIGDRMWYGYGYGAFWQVSTRAQGIYAAIGWDAWHAHNGLLELGLNLGVIGIVVFLAGYFLGLLRGTSALLCGAREEGIWILGFLTFVLLGNLTESAILEQNAYWMLYVATTCIAAPAAMAEVQPRMRGAALSPGVRMCARRRVRVQAVEG
ncbi:MAG TPA: O-antigen ligase family protein [Longimicrobium sp.]|nr:O-antigen ligase family protein [Longimicrobium sp.]